MVRYSKYPNYALIPLNTLGEIKLKQGKFAEAELYFKRSLAINPSQGEPYYYLGRIAESLGNHAAAESNYLQATRYPWLHSQGA